MKTKNIEAGTAVTIAIDLTSDPINRQGHSGRVIRIEGDIYSVRFPDGVVGQYSGAECFDNE